MDALLQFFKEGTIRCKMYEYYGCLLFTIIVINTVSYLQNFKKVSVWLIHANLQISRYLDAKYKRFCGKNRKRFEMTFSISIQRIPRCTSYPSPLQ